MTKAMRNGACVISGITAAAVFTLGLCSSALAVDERAAAALAAQAAASASYAAYAYIHLAPGAAGGMQVSAGNYTSPVYPNSAAGIDEAVAYLQKLVEKHKLKAMPNTLTLDFSNYPAAASAALQAIQQSPSGTFAGFSGGVTLEGVSASSPEELAKIKDSIKRTVGGGGAQVRVIVSTDSGACVVDYTSTGSSGTQTDARLCP